MVNWPLKLATLLHDPPNKALSLSGHEKAAFETIEQIIGSAEFEVLFGFRDVTTLSTRRFKETLKNSNQAQTIKLADKIASAIDRTAYPDPVKLYSQDYVPQALIKHPFSGQAISLSEVQTAYLNETQQFDQAKARTAQQTALDEAANLLNNTTFDTPQKRYLALWRVLPYLAPDNEHRLLPPDTRMVDHTLWNHLDAAAAVVSALPQPVFLQVSLGPVQAFIREARRTQDLWVGSYLLSYLSWTAMRTVADAYGPDAILYPALRGQPLVDTWLQLDKKVWQPLKERYPHLRSYDTTIASLPNKFTALVPVEALDNDGLPPKIEQDVREMWRTIADTIKNDFPGGLPNSDTWKEIWRRQVEAEDFPEIYWSALPWPDAEQYPAAEGAVEALRIVQDWMGPKARAAKMIAVYKRAWPEGTHAGTMYGPLHELVAATLDARKLTRNFGQAMEEGEKCTVINGLSALRWQEHLSRKELQKEWIEVHQALRKHGRFHELRPGGQERLSAIAAVKRFAQRSYFQAELGIKLAFPSTSRVTAASFYYDLMEQLGQNSTLNSELRNALIKRITVHIEVLDQLALDYPKLSDIAAGQGLPALEKKFLDDLNDEEVQEIVWGLLKYDADVLYPTRLDPEVLRREGILDKNDADFDRRYKLAQQAQETCRNLHRVAKQTGIHPPASYYAIVLMDGDQMGQWLAGEHERMPAMCEAMHPAVPPQFSEERFARQQNLINRLENEGQSLTAHLTDWHQILNGPRPLSASQHAGLSASLGNFALRCVQKVVEERRLGRVVYAGGDDLLAFLPLREALPAVRELRALFAGAGQVRDGEVDVQFNCHSGFLKYEERGVEEVLMMPGPSITLSAGVAIVHHLHPLDGALAEARRAEGEAKERYGRDALCVRLLRRSGEPQRAGGHWLVDGLDIVALTHRFKNWFKAPGQKGLSSRLVYSLASEADVLKDLPGTYQSSLKRLINRHRGREGPEAEALAAELTTLAYGLPGGLEGLARWLALARFLAQEGGEG